MAKLGDVFNLQMGKTPSRANTEYWASGTNAWVSIADLSSYEKYVEDTKEKITDLAVQESGIKLVPADTVIMSFKLSLGKTAITKDPVYTNEAIMAFLPTGKYDICTDYFFHLFSGRDWSKGTNRAVMGITLNKVTLSNMEIDVPPLEEQRCIAALLDKVTDLIAKRRAQLDKLDLLVKARFVEMFGDPIQNTHMLPVMPLGKAFFLKAGTTTPAEEIHNYSHEYCVPCYGGNGVRGYVKTATQSGDYPIIGRQGALCGNVQLASGNFHATEHAVLVKPLIKSNIVWVYYLLKYMDLYRFHTGAAQPGLAVKTLNSVDVPVAEISLQDRFATFVKKTERGKAVINCSLSKLETLKKSLMQQYFG